jgi:hypothetical protein
MTPLVALHERAPGSVVSHEGDRQGRPVGTGIASNITIVL